MAWLALVLLPAFVNANQLAAIENERVAIIQKTLPFAVVVESQDAASGRSLNVGSGVIIDSNGYILTSSQVTSEAKSAFVYFSDGSQLPAKIIGSDQLTGTSLLKVDGSFTAATLGDSGALKVGSWVLSIGNSYGMSFSPATGFVSHLKREAGERQLLQVSIPIRPGDSGAPVFDTNGDLIGVVVASLGNSPHSPGASALVGDGCDNNIGFVTPINDLKSILDEFIKTGRINRGWLGIQIRELNSREQTAAGFQTRQALLITRIIPNSPSETAGLKKNDILTDVDGKQMTSPVDIRKYVLNKAPQETVEIKILRDNQPMTFQITLGEMPQFAP